MDEAQEVRRLLAKQACIELVYRLARGIDRCDEALLRSVFHDDATDDHGLFRGTARDFIAWVLPVLRDMTRTQHLIGNVLIEVEGDEARGESYFIAYHEVRRADGEPRSMLAAGRYLDRFERRGGAWRIAHRHAVYDWDAEGACADSWDRAALHDWAFGARGAADPSCAHFAGMAPA